MSFNRRPSQESYSGRQIATQVASAQFKGMATRRAIGSEDDRDPF